MRIINKIFLSFCISLLLIVCSADALTPEIAAISAGPMHCLALDSGGNVWEWGSNWRGELTGVPDSKIPHDVPQLVPIHNVTAISAGQFVNIVLKDDGTVWWWGLLPNDVTGADKKSFNIIQVPITNVTAIYAGGAWAFATKDDGTVWAWGTVRRGYLGNGEDNEDISVSIVKLQPVRSMITNVTSIDGNGCFAIKEDGTLWAWGDNVLYNTGKGPIYGRLGVFSEKRAIPVPFKVDLVSDVKSVTSGQVHILVLKTDGTVWAWGSNYNGQLGDGNKTGSLNRTTGYMQVQAGIVQTKIDDVKAVSAGFDQSMALKSDGTVWTWGANPDSTYGVSNPIKVEGLNDVTAISSGYYHYMALKSDSSVWVWGDNHYGQAGINGRLYQNSPVEIPFDYSIKTPDAIITPANFTANQTVLTTPVPSISPLPSTANDTPAPGVNATNGDTMARPSQGDGPILQLAGLLLLICIVAGGILLYIRK